AAGKHIVLCYDNFIIFGKKLNGVAFLETILTAHLLWDDEPSKVIQPSYDSGRFHDIPPSCHSWTPYEDSMDGRTRFIPDGPSAGFHRAPRWKAPAVSFLLVCTGRCVLPDNAGRSSGK